MADLCLDSAAAAKVSDQLRHQAASGAADQDTGSVLTVAAIAAVDDGEVGALVGQDRHLFQCLPQSVAVIGIARKAAHADDEALVQRGGDADLAAELIADPHLAVGDAVDFGLMQGIDIVRVLGALVKQLRHEAELPDDAIPQVVSGDVLQVAAEIPHDPTCVALQPFQFLAHAFELLCMGVAANLQRQPRCKARVRLPQFHPGLFRHGDQLTARPLIKPEVCRMGDRLFPSRSCPPPHAVLVDHLGLLPGPDGLGQQPLHTLFADPPCQRVNEDGAMGGRCWKKVSLVKYW